jgi:hypothetical protein
MGMKTIHQYALDGDKQINSLALRAGYRIVRCEYLIAQKQVYLWVEEPLNITLPVSQQQFIVVGSGAPVPMSYSYIDTALDPFGPQAFHVYAVIPAEADQPNEASTARPPTPSIPERLRA